MPYIMLSFLSALLLNMLGLYFWPLPGDLWLLPGVPVLATIIWLSGNWLVKTSWWSGRDG